MASIEKAKRNQTLNRTDITNESTKGNAPDDTNRAKRRVAGDYSIPEMGDKGTEGYLHGRRE